MRELYEKILMILVVLYESNVFTRTLNTYYNTQQFNIYLCFSDI